MASKILSMFRRGSKEHEESNQYLLAAPKVATRANAGSVAVWSSDFAQLKDGGHLGAAILQLQPLALALPMFTDCAQLAYVLQGSATCSLISPAGHAMAPTKLTPGCFFVIPRGWTRWLVSHPESHTTTGTGPIASRTTTPATSAPTGASLGIAQGAHGAQGVQGTQSGQAAQGAPIPGVDSGVPSAGGAGSIAAQGMSATGGIPTGSGAGGATGVHQGTVDPAHTGYSAQTGTTGQTAHSTAQGATQEATHGAAHGATHGAAHGATHGATHGAHGAQTGQGAGHIEGYTGEGSESDSVFEMLVVADSTGGVRSGGYTSFHYTGAQVKMSGGLLHGFSLEALSHAWGGVPAPRLQNLLNAQKDSAFTQISLKQFQAIASSSVPESPFAADYPTGQQQQQQQGKQQQDTNGSITSSSPSSVSELVKRMQHGLALTTGVGSTSQGATPQASHPGRQSDDTAFGVIRGSTSSTSSTGTPPASFATGAGTGSRQQGSGFLRAEDYVANPETHQHGNADLAREGAGELWLLDAVKMATLEQIEMSAAVYHLKSGAMLAPHCCSSSRLLFVVSGHGRMEMTHADGSKALRNELEPGSLVVVPALYPALLTADQPGCHFVVFHATARPSYSFLAGSNSVLHSLPLPVLAAALGASEQDSSVCLEDGKSSGDMILLPPPTNVPAMAQGA